MVDRTCPYCPAVLTDPRRKTCPEHRMRRQVEMAREKKIARRPAPRACLYCGATVPTIRHTICGGIGCRRARDAARARARRAKWTEEQRLIARAAEKRWREANPDRVRANNRRSYLQDPARYAELRDAWRAKNPERHLQIMALQQSKRRTTKKAGDSRVVTAAEWDRVLRRARGCCSYCGQKAALTMDHVIPLIRGGRHAIGNLSPACEYCNKSKGRLLVMEWRMRALEA